MVIFIMAWNGSRMEPPQVASDSLEGETVNYLNDSVSYIGNNWFIEKSNHLHELYTEGAPYSRGLANGKLTEKYIHQQESAFVSQLQKMIPSEKYLKFLRYITGFMNRNLDDYVPEENKAEIYGISKSSAAEYSWIGEPFFRQMNYHAAHDIGHAMQNMMLVGCTSLSTWSSYSADSSLIIGRNFDFWVGDDFAKDKIISFVKPEHGIPFAFVTWGAFTGVSSGMNLEGLTVTINAAKSEIPLGAATPVSIVARQILQYAHNIDEAIEIAQQYTMFVSESFMVSSSKDGYSVVIEKTPKEMYVYRLNNTPYVTCANHYQSEELQRNSLNIAQMKESASVYRQTRVQELIDSLKPLTVEKMAAILRNKNGVNNANIGLGNEKSINQLIAHHSVIFKPNDLLMWVSTAPWQEGEYVCYDLKTIFSQSVIPQASVAKHTQNIAADSVFLNSEAFSNYLNFRGVKNNWMFDKLYLDPEQWLGYNPYYYDTYRIAGDMYKANMDTVKAIKMYEKGLQLEVATNGEIQYLQKQIRTLKQSKHE